MSPLLKALFATIDANRDTEVERITARYAEYKVALRRAEEASINAHRHALLERAAEIGAELDDTYDQVDELAHDLGFRIDKRRRPHAGRYQRDYD